MKHAQSLNHYIPPQTQIWRQPVFFQLIGLAILIVTMLSLTSAQAAPLVDNWAFADRDYRMPLTVQANGVARSDKIAEIEVDFGAQLTALGAVGSFDEESLRVVEVDANGDSLNTAVSFQFDNGSTADEPAGTLVFLLDGTTASSATRYYHLYFDTTGTFAPPPDIADRVQRQADSGYRGQTSFIVTTHDINGDTNAAYYYHQKGAGFASIYDRDGNDWVGYHHINPESSGQYRGIPNLGDVFHPGYSNNSGSNQGSDSIVVDDGPLKLTIQSISKDGEWEAIWGIYPTYAQMRLVQHPTETEYWMLYEGTPGGQLDYSSTAKDYIIMSDGSQINADQTHNLDFDDDWVYFADGTIDRSLFLAHGSDDAIIDSYRKQDDFNDGDDSNAMTVFGFGRDLNQGTNKLLSADDATYTVGLIDDRTYSTTAVTIDGIIQDLIITIGNEAPEIVTNDGLTVEEGKTAVITPTHLAAEDPEGGEITYTINNAPANGTLYRNAAPLDNGDTFTQSDVVAGNVSYLHDGSETTSDSFTFTVSDSVNSTGVATFSVGVTAVNDAPHTTPDSATAFFGIPNIIDLLQNDNDPDSPTFTITTLTQPAHGQVVDNGDGTVTYTADANYTGSDSFTYRASDGDATSVETAVTLNVQTPRQLYLPMLVKP